MVTKWSSYNLDEAPLEIIDGDRGKNYPKQADFSDTGHCLFLNAGNVTNSGFDFSSCSFVTQEKDRVLRKGKLKREDVVLTTRGTVGNAAYYDGSVPYSHIRINSGMVIFRANTKALMPRFLYLFLRSRIFSEQVLSLTTGSAQPQLPIRDIKRIRMPIPPLPEQRAIAHILGSLDDKIELNRQMNVTLEDLARAIFKSWFVDFDPVYAKANGEPPTGMDAATAALFPDAFEESELGAIPKGWRIGTVGADFNVTMGQSPPGETYNEEGDGLPFYQGRRDFGFRYPDVRVYCNAPTRFAKPGDTLVSVRAPVGDINMADEDCCIGRGVAAIRHKTGSRSYTYYAMQSLQSIFGKFEAEGTVFGSLNKHDFHNIEFLIPPSCLVEKFELTVFAVDQIIEMNTQESRTLAELRDTLLPKLISGEVRVPEV